MPLGLLMASRSKLPPCSGPTWRGMICTLAGRSPSLVPVLPSDGACCSGGPEVLLLGPLPSSATVAVWATGFGGWFGRAVLLFALVRDAVEAGFGAGRFCGAST